MNDDFSIDAALSAESGLAEIKQDPISAFRCSSDFPGQREFLTYLRSAEVYARTGNQAGKTTVGAVAAVALARGLTHVDGVEMPVLATPNTGALLIKSKHQGVESAVKALIEQIGDHPHHIAYSNSGLGYAGYIYIKPDRSESRDHKSWSKILVLTEDGEFPVGLRLDFVWADEPPSEGVWRELRKRGRANRPFVRFITATPLKREDWEWLRKEYKGCERKIRSRRIEVRWAIYDNKALGPEHLKSLEDDLENDPLKDAVLAGDYVDTSGMCPFDYKALQRVWLPRCKPPMRVDDDGVEYWLEPVRDDSYLVLLDPSSGVEGGDRCGMWVVSRSTRVGVARFFGYKSAYELGVLGRKTAIRYNMAMVVPEMNGGYGEAVIIGLHGYRNLYFGTHVDKVSGQKQNRIGWFTSMTSKGTIITALQKAIKADDLIVYSQEAVESLMAVIMDEQQKLVRPPNTNHEDMILLGLAGHITEQVPMRREAAPDPLRIPTVKDLLRRSMGLPPEKSTSKYALRENWR